MACSGVTLPLLAKLYLLPIAKLIYFKILTLVFKSRYALALPYLSDLPTPQPTASTGMVLACCLSLVSWIPPSVAALSPIIVREWRNINTSCCWLHFKLTISLCKLPFLFNIIWQEESERCRMRGCIMIHSWNLDIILISILTNVPVTFLNNRNMVIDIVQV